MNGYELVGSDHMGSVGQDLDLLDQLLVSGEMDLIGGAANTEIIGADPVDARRMAAARRIAQRNAAVVTQRNLDRRRRYPLGFVPTSVTAGASSQIPAAPQNLYRVERLVIPSDIAFDLGVRDIKVGNQSQLTASAEVPAALFSEVAINTGLTFDTAEVGNQISVDVRNKSGATLEFAAGLVGTIAK